MSRTKNKRGMVVTDMPTNVPMLDADNWIVLRMAKDHWLYLSSSGAFISDNVLGTMEPNDRITRTSLKMKDVEEYAPRFVEFLSRFIEKE